jgi:hypothetical protein
MIQSCVAAKQLPFGTDVKMTVSLRWLRFRDLMGVVIYERLHAGRSVNVDDIYTASNSSSRNSVATCTER